MAPITLVAAMAIAHASPPAPSIPASSTPGPTPAAPVAPGAGLTKAMEDPLGTLGTALSEIGTLLIRWGPAVLGALVILIIAWLIAGWVRKHLIKVLTKAKIDVTLSKFLGNLVKWTIMIFALITAAGTVGIPTTSFAAIIGAAGLAIGLALQGNLGNLASGVLLLVFRPFKLGDSVIIAGQTGVVDGIDLFTTNLDTGDNRRIIVPNGAIFGGVIENQTHHSTRKIAITITVRADADVERVRANFLSTLDAVTAKIDGALRDPAPGASLADLTGGQVWSLSLWARSNRVGAVREAALIALKHAIDTHELAPGPPTSVVISRQG